MICVLCPLTAGLKYNIERYGRTGIGVWLFRWNSSALVKGATLKNGTVLKLDPESTLGLAIVKLGNTEVYNEQNKRAYMMKPVGRRHLLAGTNVLCKYSQSSGTGEGIEGRLYYRVLVFPNAKAADDAAAKEEVLCLLAEATTSIIHAPNAAPAAGISFFGSMRQLETHKPVVQPSTDGAVGVGSLFTKEGEYVIFEHCDNCNFFLRLRFSATMNTHGEGVKYVMAKALYDLTPHPLDSFPDDDHDNSNSVLENTFRYLRDSTLVKVLGILVHCPTEASEDISFLGNKLVIVAKQQPAAGGWKAFFVESLNLMPTGEEASCGLALSSELMPLAAVDQEAVHQAGANLLMRSNALGEDDFVFIQAVEKRKIRLVSEDDEQPSPTNKRSKAEDTSSLRLASSSSPTSVTALASTEARS